MSDEARRLHELLSDVPYDGERAERAATPIEFRPSKPERRRYLGADRLVAIFERQAITYLVKQIALYAANNDFHEFAEGTYRKVLSGDAVHFEAVDIVEKFHEEVEANLRDHYLPRGPLPVTREEACEYMRRNGQLQWFYDRLFSHKSTSSFRSLFNLRIPIADRLVNEVVEALRDWHEELYVAFDKWESLPELWFVWIRKYWQIKYALDKDEDLPFLEMSDEQLVTLEAEMRAANYAKCVIRGKDLIEQPRDRDDYIDNLIFLEAARRATDQHGDVPNYYNHASNIPR